MTDDFYSIADRDVCRSKSVDSLDVIIFEKIELTVNKCRIRIPEQFYIFFGRDIFSAPFVAKILR